MKAKREILTMGVVIGLAGTAFARTWTSSDGNSTFEGDFVSATETRVTVKRSSGKDITFDISKLSDADQTFVKDEAKKAAAAAKAKAESEKLKDAKIPKALSRKLVKLDKEGNNYEKFELADGIIPKYYLVYYSASW